MSYYVKILDKKEKNANFEKHGSLRDYHKMGLFPLDWKLKNYSDGFQ